ncbi:MAG TPA: S1 RNA-binding domain-containing protein, partial [Armatimonadota bacterium]|nr:S1 RNA-binding domain-containing protein [Armatimonadota bacterium]
VTVSRCVASGAFVKLPEGVEAFIPIGEMSDTRINRPEDVIQPGQTVEAKVISLQARQRRMSLSLVQAASERYVAEAAASQEPGNVTIGDQFGHLLQQAVGPREEEEAPGERPEDA